MEPSPGKKKDISCLWLVGGGVLILVVLGALAFVFPGFLIPRCIVEGTLIDTPAGAMTVETLKPGSEVWTLDPAGNRERGRVLATHVAETISFLEVTLDDGTLLRVTAAHPIATPEGWVEAGRLHAGDRVWTWTADRAIRSIQERSGKVRVYDLEVEPNENFFASGVLVHNKSTNEGNARTTLKSITSVQREIRSNDRDGNQVNDFWVADVAGFYYLLDPSGQPIKLVELGLATADSDPRPNAGGTKYGPAIEPFSPKSSYAYRALSGYEDETGKVVRYDPGNGRNPFKFGVVAYPHDYHQSGKFSFVVTEENTVYRKDMKGGVLDVWPRDPAAAGWSRLD